jgi:1-hydroxycarotenoid 3,4-desaturase
MNDRVVIIGAGVGGLAAALILAARGVPVTLLEKADAPGGKMRQAAVGPALIDAGPTVFTMRWVFEEIFAAAGTTLSDHVRLTPLQVLARHAWSADERLDLFADLARSADAIGTFAGAAEARGYLRFCKRARRVYELLEQPFIRQPEPRMDTLMFSVGLRLGGLWDIAPFSTMWTALGEYFLDARLRQLFARYATYCGSSPFLAPATLMLVAHVEQEGVWSIDGGMYHLAKALTRVAVDRGATIRYGTEVAEITVEAGRASGVRLASGERIKADAIIANTDAAAITGGLLGAGAAGSVPTARGTARSLSAITWAVQAQASGFPLSRHNVFFSRNYAAEFDDLLAGSLPAEPTVYVCALDRIETPVAAADAPERLLYLVNAPANGDGHLYATEEIEACGARAHAVMRRCGLQIDSRTAVKRVTTPAEFHRLFPGTGGALYGPASHGWKASFERPGCRTRLPGLYLAGGSVHPGPGVPMAALSGLMAAQVLLADLGSRRTFR